MASSQNTEQQFENRHSWNSGIFNLKKPNVLRKCGLKNAEVLLGQWQCYTPLRPDIGRKYEWPSHQFLISLSPCNFATDPPLPHVQLRWKMKNYWTQQYLLRMWPFVQNTCSIAGISEDCSYPDMIPGVPGIVCRGFVRNIIIHSPVDYFPCVKSLKNIHLYSNYVALIYLFK